MSASTAGIEIPTQSRRLAAVVELLSSMRFAIALLTVICIASVVGTVLKQHEPINNYVNQFGPFWSEVFGRLSLYAVYSAWWFLLILAFLVVSTTLCIVRNTPKIMADLRQFKEHVHERSLQAFHHKAQAELPEAPRAAAERIGQALVAQGWKVRLQSRETPTGTGWMVAAKAGAANKIGYLAAHAAIVVICIGGLLDGDLMVRLQMAFGGKEPFRGGGAIAEVPDKHRLSDANPTFRGNLLVTEGTRAGVAVLAQPEGVILQELPFDVELKKFIVEYYDTGMPRLFASDIVIHDRYTGEARPARVEVNHPVEHRGIQIYQSSFDDGGSLVKLRALPMGASVRPFEVQGRIGEATTLTNGSERLRLEFTGLRVINVENMGSANAAATDVRAVDLRQAIEARLGAGHKTVSERTLRNVGPSVTYKLRDEAGQAREYHNYMLPIELDGQRVYLLGVRESPAEPFRYLRVPVDDNDAMDGFLRLRAALADPSMRAEAVRRYVAQAAQGQPAPVAQALAGSAQRALALFAGEDPEIERLPHGGAPRLGGLQALSAFMEANVPEAERERAGEVLLRILNGTLFELYQLSRERAGLPAAARDDKTANFMTQAVLSLSDAFFYPAPLVLQLQDFEQVQASVFQVARAPGKTIVYLGCVLLIVGVFAMLYVRERRLWVWLAPQDGGARATMALSSNRKLLDDDRAFERLRALLTSP
ncbi:cytochrome c biogenesis protein ResB [Tepidimonas taiwanensis]|uniref:Cytochrome c biogenesis protein CcsB n=1 Tax=Tepidimonas taiwanensis TaxID=307486 RepID=A0A554XE72_9BURK|nr:cytochrome c biogenesis protein ResB [Tepidimonas taiwanensis]MCX7692326.1 cytochrome c biogenesis protein ResB [Tepidimonas taiwanensis]MDM7463135.1 cytochrome c biogenesis protein ResB [Tepidimonas taiwanensis]TSE34089.1 Cytochrome c biogenesis protein CcsB [Tepidimonas taiwanensis]UBQ04936.1 cytochrome c biogenesis protein ResB [Tepidimonas taiwanensis]